MRTIRRTHAALRVMNPNQKFFHDAQIVLTVGCEPFIDIYWRNPELAGVWEMYHRITRQCLQKLLDRRLLRMTKESKPENIIFRLK